MNTPMHRAISIPVNTSKPVPMIFTMFQDPADRTQQDDGEHEQAEILCKPLLEHDLSFC